MKPNSASGSIPIRCVILELLNLKIKFKIIKVKDWLIKNLRTAEIIVGFFKFFDSLVLHQGSLVTFPFLNFKFF